MHERAQQWITVALFVGALAVMPLVSLALPPQTISEVEARELAKRPELSREALVSGRYFADWESYLSDHVAMRDRWLKAYAFLRLRVLGDSEMNGIFVGRDGYLLPVPAHEARGRTRAETEAMVATASAHVAGLDRYVESYGGRFLFVSVPNKGAFLREKYPAWIPWPDEYYDANERFFAALEERGVDAIDLQEVFEPHRDEGLYYKTDHHWSFNGAYLGYRTIVDHLGMRPLERDELEITELPNPFVGTYNRILGMTFSIADRATIAEPKRRVPYTKTANRKPSPQLYFTEDDPAKAIWYGVYMGGDWAEVVIDTNRPELPDLLLVGDSYTNAMEPLIYLNFDRTRVVDLRAYRDRSLFDYVAEHKPDIVVTMLGAQSYFIRTGNGNFGQPTAKPGEAAAAP